MRMSNKHLDTSKRPERVSLTKQRILKGEERPGYIRRWVNDITGRVESFIRAGWSPVVGKEQNISDNLLQTESQLGSVVKKVVNKDPNAACRYAVFMEIPEELYNEDQAEKQLENDRIEESYDPQKQKQSGADYGSMKRN